MNVHMTFIGYVAPLRSDTGAFTAKGHRAKWIAHPPAAASPQIHVVHLTNLTNHGHSLVV